MKKLFLLLMVVFLFFSCGKDKKSDELFYNLDLKIVSINGDTEITNDKFHKPQKCSYILFETMGDNKKYCELNTCDLDGCRCGYVKIHIDTAWLYNHCVGDIVHFDYLRKDRFFTINRNKRY